jgi:neurotransmitter:Na+ symporter, NSS family
MNSQQRESIHGQWSSRWVFILAATGSAVGLGNIWKFPYITGENGGGAFVLVYLLCIAVIGIPIMMAEVMLGRRGRRSPINTMRYLARDAGRTPRWEILGWAGVVAGFLILSYYSVIAGWAMAYLFHTPTGAFTAITSEEAASIFSGLVSDPKRLIFWHTIFITLTMIVVARGVRGGLEKTVRLLMPVLFLLLLLLVGYAVNTGHFGQGFAFLFQPDFSRLSAQAILIAMGHAFFTLSLGMGAIMMYGSYLPRQTSIARTSITIAAADTLVALLAGMAIFPIVFANDLTPGAGPGLIFQTLPIAFGHMPGGVLFGSLFFLLLVFAAWTSSISLIEPMVAWMIENHGIKRVPAACMAGGLSWLLGIGTVFSFNIWSAEKYRLFGMTFFDAVDFLTANIMLPLGGLFIAIFAAWLMKREASMDEFAMGDSLGYRLWLFLVRFITPVAVMIIFFNVIGVF